MLVSELKSEIKKYNRNELENIIIELYKKIPKSKKENYNIDGYIKNINTHQNNGDVKYLNFEQLKNEILYFLQCVDNEYYVVPNKVISKSERSSWRFKAKRYYKELCSILPDFDNGDTATDLLIEIFKRLSVGSNRLLFINWETFRALGVSQTDYYDTIMKRLLCNGYTQDTLQKCIDLLDIVSDPYDCSYGMYWAFKNNLKTLESKEISIQLIREKILQIKLKLTNEKNDNAIFNLNESLNDYVECITDIYFTLSEINNGIQFFHENYVENDKEIKEYVLLNKLKYANLKKEWVKEYEKYKDVIDFRDSLTEQYKKFKK